MLGLRTGDLAQAKTLKVGGSPALRLCFQGLCALLQVNLSEGDAGGKKVRRGK